MSKKNRKHKRKGSIEDMVTCPKCGAFSYPLTFTDPITEQEKNAIVCGACKEDMYPYMKAYMDSVKEVDEELEEGKWELPEFSKPEEEENGIPSST